jgi:NADH dehydrogenase FAD-containing subunit
VIVGGGFGGLYAAQQLKSDRVDVTLIDRRNYHLFQPLLYQVSTGSLAPGEIAAPLRSVLSRQRNTRVLLGNVVDVDPDSKHVFLEDGAILDYDSLIVAAGSQTSYFGHNDWEQWAPGMKSIEEATTIRHKILYAFEVAERIDDPALRSAWLTFVIVGAGPTGVELAGAIAEIARESLKKDFRSIQPQEAEIILLDGAPRVLMSFPEDLAEKATRSLVRLGVRVKCGLLVQDVDSDGLIVKDGEGMESIELLRGKQRKWVLKGHENDQNDGQIQLLLTTLTGLRAAAWVGNPKSEYGLDQSSLLIKISYQSGEQSREVDLKFGAANSENQHYGMSTEREGVFLVDDEQFKQLNASLRQ